MGGSLTIEIDFDDELDPEEFAESCGYFYVLSYDEEEYHIPFAQLKYPDVIKFALERPNRDFWEVSVDTDLQVSGSIIIVDSEIGKSKEFIKNMITEKLSDFMEKNRE